MKKSKARVFFVSAFCLMIDSEFIRADTISTGEINARQPAHSNVTDARTGNTALIRRGGVTLDFAAIEYFPNLKSKIGFGSDIVDPVLFDTIPYVKVIGPGLACSNVEFDHWFKLGDRKVPGVIETDAAQPNGIARPVFTADQPSDWMKSYINTLNGIDVSTLIQLTGAPAQWQVPKAAYPAIHPAPTNIPAAAEFMAKWSSASNFAGPVLWSIWNEPGHTLAQSGQGNGEEGKIGPALEPKAVVSARTATGRGLAAQQMAEIYATYQTEMLAMIGRFSQMGLASMLSPDFGSRSRSPDGRVFFQAVLDNLAAKSPVPRVDFFSFNSYNGMFPIELNGSRAVLANEKAGPIILTQYAPGDLKENPDGTMVKQTGRMQVSAFPAAVAMLDDFTVLMRATDLQNFCLSYWLGGKYGFLSEVGGRIIPQVRYYALEMYMELPILRTSIDFGQTGLAAGGLHALAGVNGSKAAALFWNDSSKVLHVPLTLINLPRDANPQLEVLSDGYPVPQLIDFNGYSLEVPAQGVALLSFVTALPDPLSRRKVLGRAQFLQTRSFPDRVEVDCNADIKVKSLAKCGATSGTYGFYDSVRAVAYLGKGTGADPVVTASYLNLPDTLTVDATVIGRGALTVSATYSCGRTVTADLSAGKGILDASALPTDCLTGPVTLTLSLKDASLGTQTEVYLNTAASAEPRRMEGLAPASDISVDEGPMVRGRQLSNQ